MKEKNVNNIHSEIIIGLSEKKNTDNTIITPTKNVSIELHNINNEIKMDSIEELYEEQINPSGEGDAAVQATSTECGDV